jgi:uncharacterized protein (TIGR03663 family)
MAVIERAVERPVERLAEPTPPLSFWERPVSGVIPMTWESVAFVAVVLLAGVLRFWDLGTRMLHHDESLHAVYSYYLYIGKGYVHDPMMHGPFLFELNALVYFLLGATDATARVAPALLGTMLVGLPWFLRDRIGRTGAVVAAALLAISPTILYYSRFIRHDIYQITFMMLLVLGTFRYLADRKNRWLFLAAIATSLAFSDKEDSYFLVAIVLTFFLAVGLRDVPYFFARDRQGNRITRGLRAISHLDLLDVIFRNQPARSPATDVLVLVGTLILPMFSAAPYFLLQGKAESTISVVFAATFAVLFGIGMLIGFRWNRSIWSTAAVLYWGIFIILYTTFFSNPNGVVTGIFGSLRYWIDQQGVARGSQPWYYYLVLLPMYEFLAVGISLGSVFYWLRHRTMFTNFLMYWCATSLILWGWASEKMPWMVIEMALPFALLAAVTVGKLIDRTDWRHAIRSGGLWLALCLALAGLAAVTLVGQGSPFDASTPIAGQQRLFAWFGIVAVFVGLVYAASHYWLKVSSPTAWRIFGLTVIALVLPFTIRAAWQVSYYHGDIPVEMLVYTQTSPDVGMVMKQIDDIAYRSGQGQDKLQVVYDSGVSWPFEWYLRNYTARTFIGTGNPPLNAPVILTGVENGRDTQMIQQLGSKYVAQRYRLRWWFPEDTTYRGLTIPGIAKSLLNQQDRSRLWAFLMYRQTPSDLGSTDFELFVRRDLAYGPWAAPQADAQTADAAALTQRTRTVAATATFGGPGVDPQLKQPRGVAVDAKGDLYIADSQNNRIVELSPTGQTLHTWGTKGTGQGQFNEPWGVTVGPDGNVYVADTWNHRVQVFGADGTFLRAWGSNPVGQPQGGDGQFFGPRSIVVDAQGNVFVTDTGNKRIEKFDATGKYLQSFGGAGTGPGFFNEPVGLAQDQQGNFYVADTWNQRIQKLGPDLQPIAAWPVAGWDSQSVVDKPYIAVDSANNVYVTDPQSGRVFEYGPNGQVSAVFGKIGNDASSMHTPTGIAVDAAGNVYVGDGDNGRVLKFAPIH